MSENTREKPRKNKLTLLFNCVCYACAIAVLCCLGFALFAPTKEANMTSKEVALRSPVVTSGALEQSRFDLDVSGTPDRSTEPLSMRQYEAAAVAGTANGATETSLDSAADEPAENILYCQVFEPEILHEGYLLFPNIGGSYYYATVDTYNPDIDYSESIGDVEYTYVASPIFSIQNKSMYTNSTTVAYKDADSGSNALETFKPGTAVFCIAVCEEENWAMVDCDGIPGYVEYSHLTAEPPAPTPASSPSENESTAPTNESPVKKEQAQEQDLVTNSARTLRGCEYYGDLAGMEIYVDPAVQKNIAKLYIDQVKNLPACLQNTGARAMLITTEDIKDILSSLNRLSARVLGCTETGSRYIYINGNLFSKNTILHEMLHAWDFFKMGAISSSHEFQSIYEQERTKVPVSPGNDQYPREFFASSGEIYYNDPDKLARIAPLTYNFFKRHLG